MKVLRRKRNKKAVTLSKEIIKVEWKHTLKSYKDLMIAVAVVKGTYTYTDKAIIRLYLDFLPLHSGGPRIIRSEVLKGRILGLWNERIFAELVRLMRLREGWPHFMPDYFETIKVKRGEITITMKE